MTDQESTIPPALRLGVDLGGAKIEIIALDASGNERLRPRVPTPQGDYMGTITAVAALVETVENDLGQRGSIGLGIPGAESAVGGGIAVSERVLTGANHIAGECGHNPLPYPEEEARPPPVCYCGRQDCVENWLSGPGLAADHARNTGADLFPQAMAERAEQGDSSGVRGAAWLWNRA